MHPQAIAAVTGIPPEQWSGKEGPDQYIPMFNLFPGCCLPVLYYETAAPSFSSPVVTSTSTKSQSSGNTANKSTEPSTVTTLSYPTVRPMRWGLVPSYHNPHEKPDFFRMFNARSETVGEKTVFKKLANQQRCIIVIDGFYEWKNLDSKDHHHQSSTVASSKLKKVPVYVRRNDGLPLLVAGLYDKCRIDRTLISSSNPKDKENDEDQEEDDTSNDPSNKIVIPPSYTETIDDNTSLLSNDDSTITTTTLSSSTSSSSLLKSIPYVSTTAVPTVLEAVKNHASFYPLIPPSNPTVLPNDTVATSSMHKRKVESRDTLTPSKEATLSTMYSCTILTCSPSSELAWLHDRMPVILNEDMAKEWLNVDHFSYDTLVVRSRSSTPSTTATIPTNVSALSSSLPFYHPTVHNLVWHTCHPRMNTVKYQQHNATEMYVPKEDDLRNTTSSSSSSLSNRKQSYGLQSSSSLSSSVFSSSAVSFSPPKNGIQRNMMDFFKKSSTVESPGKDTDAHRDTERSIATTSESTGSSPVTKKFKPSIPSTRIASSSSSSDYIINLLEEDEDNGKPFTNNSRTTVVPMNDDHNKKNDDDEEKNDDDDRLRTRSSRRRQQTKEEEDDVIDLSNLPDAEGFLLKN